LEFPEVFFAPSRPGGQDVQLWEDGGFDAVVGNPPYDVLAEKEREENLEHILAFFSEDVRYKSAEGGKLDLFRVFTAHRSPIFLEFRKFQLIESLELMRFPHFWGSWQPICHQSSKRPRRHGLVFNSLTRWKLNFQISE